jgi:HAD superfamily hydrolase (TIGR01509 family)
MKFKAAIFDLDGTLLDSLDMWQRVDEKFLARRHLAVPQDYVENINGCSFEETAIYTIKRFNLPDKPEELMQEWHELAAQEYKEHIVLNPGAKEYLQRLKAAGIKLAVATSLPVKLFWPCLKRNGVEKLFDALLSTDMVERGKEYPDLFLYAARELQVDPADCLVFEDVLPAIKSAKLAQMQVCAFYNKYNQAQKEKLGQLADLGIADFAEAPWPEE